MNEQLPTPAVQTTRLKISGAVFMDWLEQQGVIPPGRSLRRVVIDAPWNGAVRIFWEENFAAPKEGLSLSVDLSAGLRISGDEEPA